MARHAQSRRSFLKQSLLAVASLGVAPQAIHARSAPVVTKEHFDVIVVGAGAIGATTAYYLREESLKVALLDKGQAGHEASWASAGMIQPSGSSASSAWRTRAALLSRQLYDELDGRLFEETKRRIGYGGDGGLILAFEDGEADFLSRLVRMQAGDDYPARLLNRAEARERDPGLPDQIVAAALLPGHRFLDARTYTAVMAGSAAKKGVALREETPVTRLRWEGNKVVGVDAGGATLHATTVIIAAGAWAGRLDARVPMPIRPDHGQILALEGPRAGLRHNLQRLGAGGYATPRTDGRVLIGATSEDFGFEKRVTPSGLQSLRALARDLLPHLSGPRELDSWSGLRPASSDGLPVIGPDPRTEGGLLWAAGHGGYGIMQAPATARVLTDLIMNRPPRIPIQSVLAKRLVN